MDLSSVNNKTVIILSVGISFLSFVVGALFGNGIIWNMKKYNIDKIKQELELRKEINIVFYNIFDLSDKYIISNDMFEKTKSYQYAQEAHQIKLRLEMAKDNYIALENKLSTLENRDPKPMPDIYLNRITTPPTGLTIK